MTGQKRTEPLVTIAIATYNSDKTLGVTLDSIGNQNYDQEKIEVLIIDGGSSDKTLEIAKAYKCKVISNPQTDLIYAKHLGYLHAKGKYLIYLDSDESFENTNSIKKKVDCLINNKAVKAVFLSGYATAKNSHPINYYINDFGDPFSFFIYREFKGKGTLVKEWSKKYRLIAEEKNYVILDFTREVNLPLIELWAGGCMFDLEYCKKRFPEVRKSPDLIAHLFYLINTQGGFLGITKDDNTVHRSAQSISKYLKKIESRVKNNVFKTDMGKGGFRGREHFQRNGFNYKQYLFLPYALSLVAPLIDGVFMAVKRRHLIYLLHPVLALYTVIIIIFFSSCRLMGVNIKSGSYGN